MGSAFKPNKRGLDQLQRELQAELNKRPVYVRAQADPSLVLPAATTVNNYHGPVVTVTGDHAQIAWDNDTANQSQSNTHQIAPGYEDLARLLTDVLANIDTFAIGPDDAEDVRSTAATVLGEVVKDAPDQGVVRRGVSLIKGVFSSIGAGGAQAVTTESAEAAQHIIEALGNALPF